MNHYLSIAILCLVLGPAACSRSAHEEPGAHKGAEKTLQPIRIGWQTTWATQGQLAVILKRTNILELVGLSGSFIGFTYGGPLNEGAAAGQVDALFTADQPALTLCNKKDSWSIVGRLMYNRVGTIVPADSPVKSVADLRGKTIAVPYGAAAQRETLAALKAAGLDPATDVKIANVGVDEQMALAGAGSKNGRWGEIDAGSLWDPGFAHLELRGGARPVAEGRVLAVVMMDRRYAQANEGAGGRLLGAMVLAYEFYRKNQKLADRWFKEEAHLAFDLDVLARAASVEPNLEAASMEGIRVTLNEQDLASLRSTADFMLQVGLLRAPVSFDKCVEPKGASEVDKAGLPPFEKVAARER